MSAESTNIEKQTKQHRPALWGMGIAGAVVALLFLAFMTSVVATPEDDLEEAILTEQVGS